MKDLAVGDVVMVEKPLALFLPINYFKTHCFACGNRVLTAVPCSQCSLVRYCSEACKLESWESGGHRVECPVLAFHVETCYPNILFRIVAKFGVRRVLDSNKGKTYRIPR